MSQDIAFPHDNLLPKVSKLLKLQIGIAEQCTPQWAKATVNTALPVCPQSAWQCQKISDKVLPAPAHQNLNGPQDTSSLEIEGTSQAKLKYFHTDLQLKLPVHFKTV